MDASAAETNREARCEAVCFEEAGECALERVAREARAGDTVLVLGPDAWALELKRLGLAADVAVEVRSRAAGAWRHLDADDFAPRGATSVRCHGRAAERLARSVARLPVALAEAPDALPPAPAWPEERRDRIRRELGIAARERALLVAGEPSEWIDLSFVARAAGMAFVGGAPIRLVVSPRTPRIAEIGAFLSEAAGLAPLVVDARADTPWEIVPALEGVIVDRDGALERPVECAGWRAGDWQKRRWAASPLPALWALACGLPLFAHESIDLGAHASHPLATRFSRDVAQLARGIMRLGVGSEGAGLALQPRKSIPK